MPFLHYVSSSYSAAPSQLDSFYISRNECHFLDFVALTMNFRSNGESFDHNNKFGVGQLRFGQISKESHLIRSVQIRPELVQ